MNKILGLEYTQALRGAYSENLAGFSDLVCFWFECARKLVEEKRLVRAGLVATKAIAKNTNLPVLKAIHSQAVIFDAYTNEPWVIEGAAVRVSLVCFSGLEHPSSKRRLNGVGVEHINPDLTTGLDKTGAAALFENRNSVFVGIQKSGPFDVPGDLARKWISAPLNPHGRPNKDVLIPTLGGAAITQGKQDVWLIDFPRGLSASDASLWEGPYAFLEESLYDKKEPELGLLKEFRMGARDWQPREQWWTTYWPRPEVRAKLAGLKRYLVTPMTAEHRVFV